MYDFLLWKLLTIYVVQHPGQEVREAWVLTNFLDSWSTHILSLLTVSLANKSLQLFNKVV